MHRLAIETGADLKAKSLRFLREHFGKSGVWYYRVARGIDERPVEPDRPRKSVGAEDTFVTDIFELAAARAELRPLVAKLWGGAVTGTRSRGVKAGSFGSGSGGGSSPPRVERFASEGVTTRLAPRCTLSWTKRELRFPGDPPFMRRGQKMTFPLSRV
jgi:nucleotidyltransferase/DNA polymerase involved in DNA repair